MIFRRDDPPMSARPGLIAKTAIVSGPPARTEIPSAALELSAARESVGDCVVRQVMP